MEALKTQENGEDVLNYDFKFYNFNFLKTIYNYYI